MTTTVELRDAKLPDLVERTSPGDEVLITVDGTLKARLTVVGTPSPAEAEADEESWLADLRRRREMYSTGKPGLTAQEILDEMREERI